MLNLKNYCVVNLKQFLIITIVIVLTATMLVLFVALKPIENSIRGKLAMLAVNDFKWLKYEVSGRDVNLSGIAPGKRELEFVSASVKNIDGIRFVDNNIALPPAVNSYIWFAEYRPDNMLIGGSVSDVNTRRTLIHKCYEIRKTGCLDEMKYASNVPNRDQWLQYTGYAMDILAMLKTGRVEIKDTQLTVAGTVGDGKTYEQTITYMHNNSPKELKIINDIKGPLAKPFIWEIMLSADKITTTGFSNNLDNREFIVKGLTDKQLPVNSDIAIAGGAPQNYRQIVTGLLAIVRKLASGRVMLKDNTIAITGRALDEQSADFISKKWLASLPQSAKIVNFSVFTSPTSKRTIRFKRIDSKQKKQVKTLPRPYAARERADKLPTMFSSEAECSEQIRQIIGKATLRFGINAIKINRDGYYFLAKLSQSLRNCPEAIIEITGYTDSYGSRQYNKDISLSRAILAADYLINNGIDGNRIKTVGRGEDDPVLPNTTTENRKYNRRIEIRIIN